MSGYYDAEAPVYDETRGGAVRASNAADAVCSLAGSSGVLLDVAGGTGIVTEALARAGWSALVTDLSLGMLRVAAARLPGRVLQASADRLPVRAGSVDAVTTIWLLHLLEPAVADAVVAEAARVLRPGGSFVTTVDKAAAHGRLGPVPAVDESGRIDALTASLGFSPAGRTTFSGPSRWGSATSGDPVFTLAAYVR